MFPRDAIQILLSQPVIIIDGSHNVEDQHPGAVVVLDIDHRDKIVALLRSLDAKLTYT